MYLRAVITCNYYLSGDTGGIPLNREGIYIEALMKPSHYSIYRWCVYEKYLRYLRDLRFIQSSTRSKVSESIMCGLAVYCAAQTLAQQQRMPGADQNDSVQGLDNEDGEYGFHDSNHHAGKPPTQGKQRSDEFLRITGGSIWVPVRGR